MSQASAPVEVSNVSNTRQPSRLEGILRTRFITKIDELCRTLDLPIELGERLVEANQRYPLCLPESVVDRIEKGNLKDPILAQFLPDVRELEEQLGFSRDPLCENTFRHSNNACQYADCIMQKYAGRVLVVTSRVCAARCRFCFRKYYPGTSLFPISSVDQEGTKTDAAQAPKTTRQAYLHKTLDPIRKDQSIHEIIFSGGDPLALSNEDLTALLDCIKSIENVNRVRFHTRVPVLTPLRIDNQFPSLQEIDFEHKGRQLVSHITIHINSPREINDDVVRALEILRHKGYLLTSQTVLLRNINDTADTLVELFEKLVDIGVFPYYLHQLDHVAGAAHFETSVDDGLKLMSEITNRLPGYGVPKYVREIPNRGSKVNLLAEPNANVDPSFS